jgi:hypothetical protein
LLVNFKGETDPSFISCDRTLNHLLNVENKENEGIGMEGDKAKVNAVVYKIKAKMNVE